MATLLGSGDYAFEELADWAQLPEGWTFYEVADVVVDSRDRVYVFNRSEHPMMVFERDGTFVDSWGEGVFSRAHGLTLGPDDALYCVDDGDHTVRKCALDGEVLMTLGTPGQAAPLLSGEPFNRPTKVALDPATGDIYVADGYGNAKVHKYSPDGELLLSWGDFGMLPGQFNLVHSICTDPDGLVYVADRESHRVQIFDPEGLYLDQWVNMHRPCGLHLDGGVAYVGQLMTHLDVNAAYPNVGACVSIHDMSGRQLARLGAAYAGEEPGQFTTPHGLAVDSRGDIYVGEVSWSGYGRRLAEPRTARCFRKLVRVG